MEEKSFKNNIYMGLIHLIKSKNSELTIERRIEPSNKIETWAMVVAVTPILDWTSDGAHTKWLFCEQCSATEDLLINWTLPLQWTPYLPGSHHRHPLAGQ